MPKWYFWGTPESESERSAREAGYKFAPGRRESDRPYIPTLDHRSLVALKVALAHNTKPGWPGDKYAMLLGGNIYKVMDGSGVYSAETKQLFRELYNDRSIMFGEISYDDPSEFRKFRKKNLRIVGDIQDVLASCSCNSCGNCHNPGVIRDVRFVSPVCEACSVTGAVVNGRDVCSRAACDHDFRVVETVHRRAEMYEVSACKKCGLREETPLAVPISERQFLNTYEAAKALGVGHCRVRQLLRQNRFDGAIKTSRDWIIPFASVDSMREEIGPGAVHKRIGGRGHSFSEQPVHSRIADEIDESAAMRSHARPRISGDALEAMIEELRAPSEEDPRPAKKVDGRTHAGRAAKASSASQKEVVASGRKQDAPIDVKKTSPKKRPSRPSRPGSDRSKSA